MNLGERYMPDGRTLRCRGVTTDDEQCTRKATDAVGYVGVCELHRVADFDRLKSFRYVLVPEPPKP